MRVSGRIVVWAHFEYEVPHVIGRDLDRDWDHGASLVGPSDDPFGVFAARGFMVFHFGTPRVAANTTPPTGHHMLILKNNL